MGGHEKTGRYGSARPGEPDSARRRADCEPAMRPATVVPIRRGCRICMQCGRRPAITRVRGEWRVAKHHDVCRQCWRSWMDSLKAWRRAG